MASNSKIQWCDHTINFWTGCVKVSTGCKFCYMYRDKDRWKKDPTDVVKVNKSTINKVLNDAKPGDKIFTCSWSDFFIEQADQWREEAWDIIRSRPDLHWQILTKRPERIPECLPHDWGNGWKNVWLGISVENTKTLMERWHPFSIVPAYVKFISFEPLLEFIDLYRFRHWIKKDINWAIIGGESGNDTGKWLYRPCDPHWMIIMKDQLLKMDTEVFVKQTGTHIAKLFGYKDRHGGDPSEWPHSLNYQKFPKYIKDHAETKN